ncbi:MAG: oxalate:formate antiporter [Firmicutes bacterium HGW-Firmicutes-14]|nr:MAG: oxalate:formate antiporter [Firmicutes bacterium HGW-Firmicutes-14]
MTAQSNAKAWSVALSGTAINLCLGVLYAWSVIGKALTAEWGWSAARANIPYAVACGVFAVMMVVGGRLQDKIGPRIVASLGGVFIGAGMIISGLGNADQILPMIIGFGVLAGTGMGFGYGSATPPAQKWFPPYKKGLITGLVVAGYGCASVYLAPLTTKLLGLYAINKTFMILGVFFLITILLFSQNLVNPPAGYIPLGMPATGSPKHIPAGHQYEWHEMVRTPQFYLLWLMFGFGSFAGLMVIGSLAKMAAIQNPSTVLAPIFVAILAAGNAGGRIAAGFLSDKLGRTRTILLIALGQAIVLFLFKYFTSDILLAIGSASVGAFYGANLSLFPSTTADYYGTKNLGVNYGLVFTSWGVGGIFGGMVAGKIFDITQSYHASFMVAVVICLLQAALTFITKAPQAVSVPKTIPATVNPLTKDE